MSSNTQLDKIIIFRQFLLNGIDGLSAKQMNDIPAGFSNNIIWNLGHILAATQAICYRPIGEEEVAVISGLLISTMHALQSDYERRHFDNYTPSENIQRVYGIELHTIDDAIDFLLYHDGYHAGKISTLKQLV